jgi:hypothetical protein
MKYGSYLRSFFYSLILSTIFLSVGANATEYKIRLTNITSNGMGYCEETFNINTVNMYTINSINVKVGGATTIDAPGRWQIISPVDAGMPDAIFGFNVTTATHKWYESNTLYHNGALDVGQWQLIFAEPFTGSGCSQYSGLLTYDATP